MHMSTLPTLLTPLTLLQSERLSNASMVNVWVHSEVRKSTISSAIVWRSMVTPVSSTLRAAIISGYCWLWNVASSWGSKWTCTGCAGWSKTSFAFTLYWTILKTITGGTVTVIMGFLHMCCCCCFQRRGDYRKAKPVGCQLLVGSPMLHRLKYRGQTEGSPWSSMWGVKLDANNTSKETCHGFWTQE